LVYKLIIAYNDGLSKRTKEVLKENQWCVQAKSRCQFCSQSKNWQLRVCWVCVGKLSKRTNQQEN